jgi:hypothetical protein
VSAPEPWVDRDWFDNPIRPDGGLPFDPVPCPRCGVGHTGSAELEAHLEEAHGRRPAAPGRRRLSPRVARWGRGLRHLPLWFVVPVNVLVTALLVEWAGGWGGFALWAEGDQLPVIKTWLVRLSLLPTVLVLAWRQVDRRV